MRDGIERRRLGHAQRMAMCKHYDVHVRLVAGFWPQYYGL